MFIKLFSFNLLFLCFITNLTSTAETNDKLLARLSNKSKNENNARKHIEQEQIRRYQKLMDHIRYLTDPAPFDLLSFLRFITNINTAKIKRTTETTDKLLAKLSNKSKNEDNARKIIEQAQIRKYQKLMDHIRYLTDQKYKQFIITTVTIPRKCRKLVFEHSSTSNPIIVDEYLVRLYLQKQFNIEKKKHESKRSNNNSSRP